MGFAEINEQIQTKKAAAGGEYVKLNRIEHGTLQGTLVDVSIRTKVWKKKEVTNKDGVPRKEWILVIETKDGVKKFAANESAQWAIQGTLKDNQQLAKGGRIQIKVVEDPEDNTSQAEYKVFYSDPVQEFPVDTPAEDEPPY